MEVPGPGVNQIKCNEMGDLTKVFNGQNIRVRKGDNYLNANDMLGAFGKKRNYFGEWCKYKAASAYISVVSRTSGIPEHELIDVIQKGTSNEGRGTWIHPDVAIRFAMDINEDFGYQVVLWVRELLSRGEVHLSNSVDVATGELKPLDQQLVEMQERIEGLVEALESEGIDRINAGYQLEREKKLHSQTIKERDHWMEQYDRLRAKMRGLIS